LTRELRPRVYIRLRNGT